MGEHVSGSAYVDATPGTVREVITDLAAYPEWAEGVVGVDILEVDSAGLPMQGRFLVDAKVTEVTYTLQYAYTDNVVSWSLAAGEILSQLDGSYELEERDGGTSVQYTLEADVSIPLPGFLKKRAAKHILEQGLIGLKRRAEAMQHA